MSSLNLFRVLLLFQGPLGIKNFIIQVQTLLLAGGMDGENRHLEDRIGFLDFSFRTTVIMSLSLDYN